jgi:hypothetical protein
MTQRPNHSPPESAAAHAVPDSRFTSRIGAGSARLVSATRAIVIMFTAFLILLLRVPARCADTNILIISADDTRAGAVFFVDECLTRGITNSISIGDLRGWATNLIQRYQQLPHPLASTNAVERRFQSPLAADVPEAIKSIQSRIPSCRSAKPLPKELDQAVEQLSKVWAVSKEEAEVRICTLGPDTDPPQVEFWRSSQGTIEAVTINWYIYGVIVGPETFKPDWEHTPWYNRKLADGIYLWHGYK